MEVFDRGEQAKVPMLAGFNSGENRSRALLPAPAADATTYEKEIRDATPTWQTHSYALYPSSKL